MRRLLSIFFVVLVCAAAAVMAGAGGEGSQGKTYKIIFDNAFGLTEGGDFRVGGVNAGQTSEFKATDSSPPKAEVTVEVTEPGFGDFRKDAECIIKPQSLIGEYFVDCQLGTSKDKLEEGARSPSSRPRRTSRRIWSTTSCARPTASGCG